jgi:hypothetical protein
MHRVAQAFVVALTLSVAFAGWSDNLIDDPIDFGDFFVTSTTENLDGQPDFTHSYHVTGKILIPYAEIEEPFEAWYDVSNANNTQSRVDYYDGVMATYQLQHPAEFGVMRKVPSARLTLHSTKLCTKFKIFRKKIFSLLRLPLRHFKAFPKI